MIVALLKELTKNENRVAATPQSVKDLIKNGASVNIESAILLSFQMMITNNLELISAPVLKKL
mgnify:CR=1 FL=1